MNRQGRPSVAAGALAPAGAVAVAVGAMLAVAAPAASAQTFTLKAKAVADECFRDFGDRAGIDFDAFPETGCDAEAGYQPKINESYVWSLVGLEASGERGGTAGPKLFFGTSANTACQVRGGLDVISGDGPEPLRNDLLVCEYAFGPDSRSNGGRIPDTTADTRPPGIYAYLLDTDELVPLAGPAAGVELPPRSQSLLEVTVGLRGGVAFDDLVLLFGPSVGRGINAFAFDASTHEFLGSDRYPEFTLLRKCLVVPDSDPPIPYCAVGTEEGGAVIRMTGTRDDPFRYEQVGRLQSQGSNIAWSSTWQRVFVATWARSPDSFLQPPARGAIWRGPRHPDGGYPPSDALWQQIFNVGASYEVDPLVRAVIGMGDLTDCNGELIFGTLLNGGAGGSLHISLFPELYGEGGLYEGQLAELTERATAIFTLRQPAGPAPELEMLYGNETLPAFDFETQLWSEVPNAGNLPSRNQAPDGAGFGKASNLYDWIAFQYGEGCYVGTYDSRLRNEAGGIDREDAGADLWRFDGTEAPAVAVDTRGAGNLLNYGLRTVAILGDRVFLGTANPYNLQTPGIPPTFGRGGGWELLEFVP